MEEDQKKYLENSINEIKKQTYFMKKALDENDLDKGLEHSRLMLMELRTSVLSPKNYFVIIMQIFDQMRILQEYLKVECKNHKKISELYEKVQYIENIVPRLYLLITVGTVYLSTNEVACKDILNDLLDMLKGVQNSIRGLFLRYFLLKMSKDKLPDITNVSEGNNESVMDSIEFILDNFYEMNKLWVKMECPLNATDQQKLALEKERNDLKATVGENLVRLSQLEGCSVNIYQDRVMYRLIETICSSRDIISQQYLMDCIIQAFPDEYHLHTLEKILPICYFIFKNGVDINTIFSRLMNRLANFALGPDNKNQETFRNMNIFSIFKTNIDKIIKDYAQPNHIYKLLELQAIFLKFSLSCYPNDIQNVNSILQNCYLLFEKRPPKNQNEEFHSCMVDILTLPLENMPMAILAMKEYPLLIKSLPYLKKRSISAKIIKSVINSARAITNEKLVKQIIQFFPPLIKGEDKDSIKITLDDIEQDYQSIAKLTNLIYYHNPDSTYEIIEIFKNEFMKAEINQFKYLIPPLFFSLMKLAKHTKKCLYWNKGLLNTKEIFEDLDTISRQKIYNIKANYTNHAFRIKYKTIYDNSKELIEKLTQNSPELALKLYLELLLCINEVNDNNEFDEYAYNIATNVLVIYQDEIIDIEAKNHTLTMITGTLYKMNCFSSDNYDILISNTVQYSGKILKKADQCAIILNCTHLFYSQGMKNEKKILENIKKCFKLADLCWSCQPISKVLYLYILLLNKYIYYLNILEFESIKEDDINNCIAMIKDKKEALLKGNDDHINDIIGYFNQTLKYIQYKMTCNRKFKLLQKQKSSFLHNKSLNHGLTNQNAYSYYISSLQIVPILKKIIKKCQNTKLFGYIVFNYNRIQIYANQCFLSLFQSLLISIFPQQ